MAITQITGARVFYRLSADALPVTDPVGGNLIVGDLLVTEDGNKEQYSYGQAGWYQREITNGTPHVRTTGSPAQLVTRDVLFSAAADGVAFASDVLTITVTDLITLDTFGADKKRARITAHFTGGGIPFMPTIVAAINAGDPVTAAARLSTTPTKKGGTGNVNTSKRMISEKANVIEWNLEGTTATVDDIYLAGIASNLAGTADVLLSVEVW